ncbi:bifunctional RNase H/acid phosphatase [Rhodobacteraceae bacterium THAF1]|uniref:histidine phosphatase family protein n=1 Tax=Palleronia sp. THAF1 TaxID=2587842 RepID=UPI000F3FD542|nr:histidine phosphatase family protein [Palleronia sp. THAF1]QFU10107.1 bifunctional RNase H/acid phosphatase [Palleronia sp. THAF1]VDC16988.1 bifunctional RNase H/acid phosphatase [Rhodobacteraceae bacterium THAF1]
MPTRPDLFLIRHAPVVPTGLLAGRSDLDCVVPDGATVPSLPEGLRVVSSPARRCVKTARALFPGQTMDLDPGLWEQDFGVHDGKPLADLPDLGPLSGDDLAQHRWEGGESFADACARICARLAHWGQVARDTGPIALVCHAGTVRAGLSLALGRPGPALSFEVAPLSVTRLTAWPGGWAVGFVNRIAP